MKRGAVGPARDAGGPRIGVGSGGPYGRAEHPDGLAPEDLIKRPGELAIPIAHQEPHRAFGIGPLASKIPRLLGDPGGLGVRRAAPEVHPPAPQLDEEQDVERLEPHRLDRKEVTGQDARRLLA